MNLRVFWGAVTLILYTYLIFPALVVFRGLLRPRRFTSAEITPRVSVIIAAHNEAASIGAKLDNILSLDYPRASLEVIVASDGSNDATEAIVSRYAAQGVRLLALPRRGKAPALNAAVAVSTGEILVFSDANSMYMPGAIGALVRPFADPSVGGVAGNQRYLRKPDGSGSSDGEQSYWNFDRRLKEFESRAGNTISATGAIYAIRRSLFRAVPPGVTDDFVTSTSVIAQGQRLVFAPDAIALEPVAGSSSIEFGRKVRVITRGLRGVLVMRELLNPFRYGFYALQLFSHKVLRRLVVFPLIMAFIVSPTLWKHGLIYQVATLLQVGFYGCGAVGLLLARQGLATGRRWAKLFTLPFFFCMVNTASLLASANTLLGRRIDFWEPQRQVPISPGPGEVPPAQEPVPAAFDPAHRIHDIRAGAVQ